MDVVEGLSESVRLDWSGDVDLDDGSLQLQYETYITRLNFLKGLRLKDHTHLIQELQLIQELKQVKACIIKCLNSLMHKLAYTIEVNWGHSIDPSVIRIFKFC